MAYCTLMAVIVYTRSWSSDRNNGRSTHNSQIHLENSSSLPDQSFVGWIVHGIGGILIVGTFAALAVLGSEHPRPPQYLCRVYMWTYAVGAVARLWNLTAFSLSVLAIVWFGKKTISLHCAAVILTILWLAPIAISLYILLPRWHVFLIPKTPFIFKLISPYLAIESLLEGSYQ